ncbi:hypothetical protein PHYBLDRAFT_59232 [Phycomyces blakesleeanus NRRL 1555(-)]|uniref:Uncharacterized protein n=1 Tax=Phycomyces blakesleeanus (strain ATCC 8743b / DSM 1359 / FGSC 10004 / NBRC 33097 / NRRL 1555) TaxID=763407 RepID=A0A167QSP2_PHYB8|nr:hypothetical protein PHYBLDRAFT_59232 [Phycomyces blakesleeanus NRRL 1555(-)]OAD80198.1 hypothetical protein PHYBLDRAFT_59232 [Phycomyces blakesleeanus NRRL 1555(-)]|eukprot:XP_018298238.1 hypothetical protein PHYBLDRAFT_59232 [Phycomyces blakesleeanus NRRL 1555(-)]
MFSITNTLPYEYQLCHTCYSNKAIAVACQKLCLGKMLKAMMNNEVSEDDSSSESSQFMLSAIPSLMLEENTNMISNEISDISNNTDLDKPMYDIEYESNMRESVDIDGSKSATSPLVFDFSQPSPVLSNNDAKNLEFIKIINDFGISCQAHKKLAAHLNNILEMSTKITYRVCTPYLGKELLKHFSGVEETVYDVCQSGFMMFNVAEKVACKRCGKARYKSNKTDKDGMPIAEKTMVQISLASDTRHEMLYHHNHEQKADGSKVEIFARHTYQSIKHLFSGENDVAISLSVNGFAPHNVPSSITILHATVLNLSLMVHYEKSQMLQIAIISGPSALLDFWSFLKPTLADLKVLQEEGMIVVTPTLTIHTKVHVLVVTGDILAVAKLACHTGHMSKTNLSSKSLVGQSPLSSLASFMGPFFFTLDEIHGLCHRIGKQVWGLIGGKYGIKHSLFLPANVLKEIGVAMVATRKTVPTAFHGSWRNVSKYSRYFKTVDCADFLLFVVPTLVAERHLLQHYPNMIGAFGPPRAYSTRSVEHAIGKYSHAIKSNLAIGMNAGNVMVWLARTWQLLTDSEGGKWRDVVLQYEDMSAGWLITSEGKHVSADSDIEFWGPLGYKTIDDSFEDISCLLILIRDFYRSKGVECGTIEPAIITSHKAFIKDCVVDFSFSQKTLRKAHHICLQMQVDLFTNVCRQYTPMAKDFFGKVILFFEHENSSKRWPLVLVLIYSTVLYNDIPVVVNGQLKPKVVHLADVKELVGLVVSDAMGSTTTPTTTKYIVWPELNRSPKLNLG